LISTKYKVLELGDGMIDLKNFVRSLAKDILGDQVVSNDHYEAIYRQIEEKIDNEPPPRFAFIGETGVGKSSTLNALFNAGCEVSHTESCTQNAKGIEIPFDSFEGANGSLIVYDMPGLGESRNRQIEHIALYESILKEKVDVALWVLDAQNRAIASVQEYLEAEINNINPKLLKHMVFALNKVDLVYPGESAWHPLANIPSEEQEENINGRIKDVKKKILEVIPYWRGTVVGYSSSKRYNLPQLFSAMLDAVPQKRQWVVASRKALADFLELVDPELLPPEKRRESYQNDVSFSQSQKTFEIIKNLPPEEFSKLTSNKDAFLEWLKHNNQ
jgi:uncharacterized protein